MKLSSEQLELAQGCATAEELVGKAAGAGMELSLEQAQKLIDASEFAEIEEDDLGMIAGGGCGSDDACCKCGVKKDDYAGIFTKINDEWYCEDCADIYHPGWEGYSD